jgi:hypothetical protein
MNNFLIKMKKVKLNFNSAIKNDIESEVKNLSLEELMKELSSKVD